MNYTYLLMILVTVLALALLRQIAPRIGLVDSPSGHRQHQNPTPLVGGIAVFAGLLVGVPLAELPLEVFRPLLLGCGILVLIGALDDVHQLSSVSRFAAQIIAALIMVYYGNVALLDLGDLIGSGPVTLGAYAVPLTVFATVGVINSMNMSDGMDGLAGTLFLVPFATLIWIGRQAGVQEESPLLVMVMLGVACFLLFNARLGFRSHASVFLGDAGSTFLGFLLSWVLIRYSQPPFNLIDPVTALWLVAVPLIDTVTVMLRRMFYRRSPFAADRTHLHHLLLHRGLSVNAVLAVVLTVAVAFASFGIATESGEWPEPLRFYLFLALFGAHFLASGWYVHSRRLMYPERGNS